MSYRRLALLLLIALILLPLTCLAQAQDRRAPVEGMWIPADSTQDLPALYVMGDMLLRADTDPDGLCELHVVPVRWSALGAAISSRPTATGDSIKEVWRFQKTAKGDTAVVRHNRRVAVYRRTFRDVFENCIIEGAEPDTTY